ncbi:MAG TPA: glycosyltransferase, partial [Bryobacteraceae bacterium]
MSFAAILPVWNGRNLLARLLDTLDTQTLPIDDLIVIDNGSTDGAPDLARARGARAIPMGHNAGFAAAINRGLEEAQADYIAILNSDVELSPNYFATLIASLEETKSWFATGKIVSIHNPGQLDATFDLTSRGAATWRAGNARPDSPTFAQRREIYSAPLTAAVFRSVVFAELKK